MEAFLAYKEDHQDALKGLRVLFHSSTSSVSAAGSSHGKSDLKELAQSTEALPYSQSKTLGFVVSLLHTSKSALWQGDSLKCCLCMQNTYTCYLLLLKGEHHS